MKDLIYDSYLRLEDPELSRAGYWGPNMVTQDSKGSVRKGRQAYKCLVTHSAASFAEFRFLVATNFADHTKFLQK